MSKKYLYSSWNSIRIVLAALLLIPYILGSPTTKGMILFSSPNPATVELGSCIVDEKANGIPLSL